MKRLPDTKNTIKTFFILFVVFFVFPVQAQSVRPITATPSFPDTFLTPENDRAGQLARIIARHFLIVPNMRAQVEQSTWISDPSAIWSIRSEQACLNDLRNKGVDAIFLRHPLTKIPTPVVIINKVKGVRFQHIRNGPVILSCEFANKLPTIAEVVKRYDIHTVDVLSSFRKEPETSFHHVGLALDIVSFQTKNTVLSVYDDFIETPDQQTCLSNISKIIDTAQKTQRIQNAIEADISRISRAETLLNIACDLTNTHHFSTVITPNYKRGHDDHFHIDARPNDPRIFLR